MEMPEPDARVISRKDDIVAQLTRVLPAGAVISDPAETRAYECDALTAYRCPPLAVVLPASTEEVVGGAEDLPRDGRAGRAARLGHVACRAARCRPPIA